jgi:pimeloyl-ACP methyl ester carboxylesterase
MQLELISRQPDQAVSPTPLLFVHGAWHAAWCWEVHFLPYFAQHGYACHALSLRGHGGSEGRERLRWWRVADYVADVAQAATSLPAPPVVVGHSAGGFIVQKYLETHQPSAAVLLAPVAPTGLLPIVLSMAARHPLVFLGAMPTLDMRRLVGTPELSREWLFSAEMPADQVARFAGQMQNESFLAFLDMALLRLVRRSRIHTPLLVLGAEGDRLTPPRTIEATARAYGAPVQIFPGMAHDMMLEPRWEAVAERILVWLGQSPAAAS